MRKKNEKETNLVDCQRSCYRTGFVCAGPRNIVRHRLEELDERMKEMRRYRRELGAALAQWEETGELDGHVCGLIEGTKIEHPNPIALGLSKKKRRK